VAFDKFMKVRGCIWGLPSAEAFTRVDFVALMFVLFLAGAVASPLFSSRSRAQSDTLVCQANLGEIGRAYQLWAGDHDDRNPFLVESSEGGLRRHPLAPNSYIQFSIISNGVSSPKVFVCPADTNTTRRAKDFSARADGGFMHPAYRNNAISYLVSFHALRYMPRAILSGDRNIEPFQVQGCSYALFSSQAVQAQSTNSGSLWAQSIHWSRGNLLFNDGSVEETATPQLRANVISNDDDGVTGTIHVLLPR
jgi:hypothetical protein